MTEFVCTNVLLENGWAKDIVIRVDGNGKIEAIYPNDGPSNTSRNNLSGTVLPGMINLHSHAHQRAMAGLAESPGTSDDNFWSWREIMYRAMDRIQPDDLYSIACQLYTEMLKSGYTHVCEFQYLHNDSSGQPFGNIAEMSIACIEAARVTGIGLTILPVFYVYSGFGQMPATPEQRRFVTNTESYARIVNQIDQLIKSSALINIGVAPHSIRACDHDSLRYVEELASQINPDDQIPVPVHIHIAEQIREVEDCIAWSGARPVEWLFDHATVGPNWCLIHATHATAAELKAIVDAKSIIGVCPTTEANLGDGVFDAVSFTELNGLFGIGSDSQISISPTEELRWFEYVQRLQYRRRNVLSKSNKNMSTGSFLYREALDGGRRAAAVDTGSIAVGNRADMIVLKDNHPLLHGRESDSIIDSYIFSGNSTMVDTVIVNGQPVVEHGVFEDSQKIADSFRATIDRLNLGSAR